MKSGYSLVSAVRALVATVAVSSLAVLSSQAVWAQSLGTVTIGTHLDVDTLDPTQNINTHQRWVYRHIFDPLITLSADGKVLPAAAQRWEQIDPLTWRFHLRRDVKFHNGEPLTAAAVKLSVELMQKPASQARSYYSRFKEVRVVDDYTVDLITEKPFANALILVADYLLPVPPKYFAEVGAEGIARRPIGTGAYKFVSWRRGDRIILEANRDWWNGRPKADRVVFWPIPEPGTRVAALLNGEAQLISNVPQIQVEKVKGSSAVRIEAADQGALPIWGGLVVDREGLKDKRVRQAINYAVNKQAIVDRLLQGYGRVMGQPCSAQTSCFDPTLMAYPYDPDKARALLREAGVQNLSLKLNFPTGVVSNGPELSQAIAADLARVGIKTEIIQDEWKVFAEKLFDFKNKQANLGDLFLMYYKAGPTIELVLSTVLVTDKNWNWTHYSNPKVDNAWNQAEATVDVAKRTAMFKEMAAIVRDEAPWLFLYEPLPLYGVSNKINWKVRADEFIYVEDMTAR